MRLTITFINSNSYLFLYSSSLFVFEFSIIVIIVGMSFTDFDIVYTINFLIALLILSYIFIEVLSIYSSTIKYVSLIFLNKIVLTLVVICRF